MGVTEKDVKASRAAYMRAYRKKNPDKIKEINDNYWRKRAERENQKKMATQEG